MAATAVRYLRSAGSPTTAGPPPPPSARRALRAVQEDERPPLNPAEFRRGLGHFASGVTVVATTDEAGPTGFACQSFSSLSLDPPLIAFMVARTSTTWPRIARAGAFCANILGADQGELCRGFAVSASRRPDKFAGVRHQPAPILLQADQIVAVGAEAMQQDDQPARLAARQRRTARSGQLGQHWEGSFELRQEAHSISRTPVMRREPCTVTQEIASSLRSSQ